MKTLPVFIILTVAAMPLYSEDQPAVWKAGPGTFASVARYAQAADSTDTDRTDTDRLAGTDITILYKKTGTAFAMLETAAGFAVLNDEAFIFTQEKEKPQTELFFAFGQNFYAGWQPNDRFQFSAGKRNAADERNLSGRMNTGPGLQLVFFTENHSLRLDPVHLDALSGGFCCTDGFAEKAVSYRQHQRRIHAVQKDSKRIAHSLSYMYSSHLLSLYLLHTTTSWTPDRLPAIEQSQPRKIKPNRLHSTTLSFLVRLNAFSFYAGARNQNGSFETTEKTDTETDRIPVTATTAFAGFDLDLSVFYLKLFYYFPEPSHRSTGSVTGQQDRAGAVHTGISPVRSPVLAGHYDTIPASSLCVPESGCMGTDTRNELPVYKRPSAFAELLFGFRLQLLHISFLITYIKPLATIRKNAGKFFKAGPDNGAGDLLEGSIQLSRSQKQISWSLTYSRLHVRPKPGEKRSLHTQSVSFAFTFFLEPATEPQDAKP